MKTSDELFKEYCRYKDKSVVFEKDAEHAFFAGHASRDEEMLTLLANAQKQLRIPQEYDCD